ncbi:MAG: penicillin-binding protein 1C, partial [Bdellovibrionales bacterium]
MRLPLKRSKLVAIALAVAWGAGWWGRAPLLDRASYSKEVFDSEGRLLRFTLSGDEKYRKFVPLKEIPPELVNAVLAQEDRYFRFHAGVNPFALFRAVNSSYIRRGRKLGASTITMQLARMRSTRGSKTLTGKAFQIAGALGLEALHTKSEILEAYLNSLPFGANIEGVSAASRILFNKPLARLSAEEIARMVAIPQNPSQYNGHAARSIARLPFAAPHFVNLALERLRAANTSELHLTLDRALQILTEQKLKAFVAAKRAVGIQNGAVMILNHETMEVVAQVGSADFFDSEIEGQVNGATAYRSPGSALKPFVYALAIDQGLIHPLTLLKDSPASFGGFDPENFDQKFAGPISATEALVHSRNVPAVYLSSLLKNPDLHHFLELSGVRRLREPGHYGLAIALGAAEVTMEDLVRLYAMLANGGDLKSPKYFMDEKGAPARPMISSEAAFMTLAMLRENPRSEQRGLESLVRDAVPVAWKTGTSNGFRDAWTVGVVGPYVVAVWLGNFNNDSNRELVGRDLAAPLFFSLVDGLRSRTKNPPRWISPAGLGLKKIKVCALSGQIPGHHCHAQKETWFIPGKSPIAECTIHREILVSKITGERACDEKAANLKRQVFEFWPSDLLMLFRTAGVARRTPPAYGAGCHMQETQNSGVPPAIVSPRKDVVYSLRVVSGQAEAAEMIPFSAIADG